MIPSQLNRKFAELHPNLISFEISIATSLNIHNDSKPIEPQIRTTSTRFYFLWKFNCNKSKYHNDSKPNSKPIELKFAQIHPRFDFLPNFNCIIEIILDSNLPAVDSWQSSGAGDNQDPANMKSRPICSMLCKEVRDEGAAMIVGGDAQPRQRRRYRSEQQQ